MDSPIIVHTHVKILFGHWTINYQFIDEFLGRFVTADAPWNITQWVDPFDPHPKMPTMPVILVVRKGVNWRNYTASSQ